MHLHLYFIATEMLQARLLTLGCWTSKMMMDCRSLRLLLRGGLMPAQKRSRPSPCRQTKSAAMWRSIWNKGRSLSHSAQRLAWCLQSRARPALCWNSLENKGTLVRSLVSSHVWPTRTTTVWSVSVCMPGSLHPTEETFLLFLPVPVPLCLLRAPLFLTACIVCRNCADAPAKGPVDRCSRDRT